MRCAGGGAGGALSPTQLNDRLRALDGAAVGGEKRSGTRKGTGLWTICDGGICCFLGDNFVSTAGLSMPLGKGPPYTQAQVEATATENMRACVKRAVVTGLKRVAEVSSDCMSRSSSPGSKSSSVASVSMLESAGR